MKIAVVILNWNGKNLLEKFLPSVVAHSAKAAIYVADNASSDDSVEFVRHNFSKVTVIEHSQNNGYAKGYNDTLKQIEADLFVLLNSDVEVTPNWLEPVIDVFEKNPKVVAAQPKILDYNKPTHFEYAGAGGGFIDQLGYPYCRGRIFESIEKDNGQYDDTIEIFWATGAALFVRSDAFHAAGGLDEDFFAHQEEIDLCWRLQAKGGVIKYVGASTIYHVGGGSLAASHPKKTFFNFRNTLLMLLKNTKGSQVYTILFIRLILDGPAGLRFLFQGKVDHFFAILRAHFSFYKLFIKFRRKRKQHASNLQYFQIKSILWKYYISKKRNFNEL